MKNSIVFTTAITAPPPLPTTKVEIAIIVIMIKIMILPTLTHVSSTKLKKKLLLHFPSSVVLFPSSFAKILIKERG